MISWVAIDRMIEEKMLEDAAYREKAAGKPMRFDAILLGDGEIVDKLRSFGVELDRPSLESLCKESLSAQEIAEPLIAKRAFKTTEEEREGNWIWVCVEVLWRRWFPDEPSFEMLDDKMQEGYKLRRSGHVVAACHIWLEAWGDVLGLFDKADFETIHEFDERFQGTRRLFDWVQDLELDLWNASFRDRRFLARRIEVCEERLRRFDKDDDPSLNTCRRAVAQSWFELGEPGKADDLYRKWLGADPQWGWGWIGWSDCYYYTLTQFADLRRAQEILLEGLSIAGVEDAAFLADRLANLYVAEGREDEANEARRQSELLHEARRQSELMNTE
ncbi:MAG: hypothetical protein MOB07_30860 [Acidobacteria bacterium]|nr:hypothetical protein [Acidobacteriota bacterium]